MLLTQVAGAFQLVQRPVLAGVVEVRIQRVAADVIDAVALAEFKRLPVGGASLGADVHAHGRKGFGTISRRISLGLVSEAGLACGKCSAGCRRL